MVRLSIVQHKKTTSKYARSTFKYQQKGKRLHKPEQPPTAWHICLGTTRTSTGHEMRAVGHTHRQKWTQTQILWHNRIVSNFCWRINQVEYQWSGECLVQLLHARSVNVLFETVQTYSNVSMINSTYVDRGRELVFSKSSPGSRTMVREWERLSSVSGRVICMYCHFDKETWGFRKLRDRLEPLQTDSWGWQQERVCLLHKIMFVLSFETRDNLSHWAYNCHSDAAVSEYIIWYIPPLSFVNCSQ